MITNKNKTIKKKKSPLLAVLLHKTKTKNSILRLKLAGEPSQRASQTLLLPTGGESGIRTHVSQKAQGFSKPSLWTTQPSLLLYLILIFYTIKKYL